MKRSGAVSVGLFLALVLVTVSLFRDASNDGLVPQFSLGVHALCLAVIGLGLYVVRSRNDVREFWPDDLDDVWPDDPEPVSDAVEAEAEISADERLCPELSPHDRHSWSDQTRATVHWCPGSDHTRMATPDPGKWAQADTVVLQPTEVLPPVPAEADPWLEEPGPEPVPCTNRRFHAAHDGCPGRSGKRKAASA